MKNAEKYWKMVTGPQEIYAALVGLIGTVIVLVTSEVFSTKHHLADPFMDADTPYKVFALGLGMIFGLVLLVFLWKKYLRKRHPEMRFLGKWVNVYGSPRNYPLAQREKLSLANRSVTEIEEFARRTNATFLLRNTMRMKAKALPERCPERFAIEAILPAMEQNASIVNQEYLDRYDLLRQLIGLTEQLGKNPRQYREGLPNQ